MAGRAGNCCLTNKKGKEVFIGRWPGAAALTSASDYSAESVSGDEALHLASFLLMVT
jgi:hypothetical protein